MQLRHKFTLLAALAGSVLLAGLWSGCGKSETKARIYVVGTEAEFPPFEFKTDKGELTGFDIDLIKAAAAKAGIEIRFQEMAFDGLIPALQSGQIDVIASALSITDDRKKNVTFSDPYIEAGLSVAVAESNTSIKTSADLVGKSVAVQQGSTGAEAAEKLKAEGKIGEVRQFTNVVLCMMELTKGGVDAVINDRPTSAVYISKQPGKIKLLPETLVSDAYGFAFSLKAGELAAKINKALAELKADGTYATIEQKYFTKE